MATFYTSLDNQRDILPTPCSGDQKLASFPDSLVHSNDMMMMYLNQPSSAEPYSMMSIPPTSNTTSYVHLNSPIGDLIGSDKNKELRGYESFLLNLSGGNSSTVKAESCNPLMRQYESADIADTILNSKYLTETQHLLNEVVSVQQALKQFDSMKRRNVHASELDASREADERSSSQSMLTATNGTIPNATESKTNGSAKISPAEMQDLQNKKAKLLSMLDEVDRRYRQYCHHMQMVVSSFDSIVGCGAAKSYTTLARQTISCHFRSLRDAISGQIQEIKKSLGEQETGIPRLRSVDHHIRHHLRMMRHAWRPQRGLPESSVSTLRAWLFEHFLHPYPNDSEKITLARQTGLSRNQVANWFINARVRLWKPMVEEMYKEEFGDSELNSNSLENPSNAPKDNYLSYEDGGGFHRDKILRSGAIQLQDDQRPMAKDHSLHDATATDNMAELNGLGFGDQVSFALGLHRCETDAYPMSSSVGAGTVDYLYVDSGKQQHRRGQAGKPLNAEDVELN